MKTSSFKITLGLLALSGTMLLSPFPARPQASAAQVDPNTGLPEEPRVFLDIQQGVIKTGGEPRPATVANVVQRIQAQVPDANFVLSPGVGEIVVSNLTLRSANVEGTLTALGYATGNKVRASSVGKGNLYAVILGQAAHPEKGVEAFNLMPVMGALGARDAEAIRQRVKEISSLIIQTLTDFDTRTGELRGLPLLNFSDSTGLLVVIGHPEHLQIVSKIVKALNPSVRAEAPAESWFKKAGTPGETQKTENPSERHETTR